MSSKKKICRFIRIDKNGKPKPNVKFDVQIPSISKEWEMEAVRKLLWKKINDAEDNLTRERITSWAGKTLGHEGSLSMEVKELFRRMIEWATSEETA